MDARQPVQDHAGVRVVGVHLDVGIGAVRAVADQGMTDVQSPAVADRRRLESAERVGHQVRDPSRAVGQPAVGARPELHGVDGRLTLWINGKLRDTVEVEKGLAESEIKDLVLNREKIKFNLAGKPIKKFIFVPDKLVSLVI
jgi:hypothetical protein